MNPHIPHHKIVLVARASIISESEVSITLLCSPCYTAVQTKNCYICNYSSHYEKYNGAACPSHHLKLKYLCQLCLTRYTAV